MKRYTLLLILLVTVFAAFAQQNSAKIIFFRNANYMYNDAFYRVKLFADSGNAVIKVGRKDVMVYNIPATGKTSLKYKMKFASFGATKCAISIGNAPGRVHFVRIYNKGNIFFARTKMQEINKEEFLKYYNSQKWLRDKLTRKGYPSVDELVKN